MRIESIEIQLLKCAEYNPRFILPQDLEQLKKSITDYGFVEPLVVNSAEERKNIVIGGHQRLKAAQELGMTHVPVFYISLPDLKKEQALNLRLNRNLGKFDFPKLIESFDKIFLQEVGFEPAELLTWTDTLNSIEDVAENEEGIKKIIKVICNPDDEPRVREAIQNVIAENAFDAKLG